MENEKPAPASGFAKAFGGLVRSIEALKAAAYAAIASVVIGLGLSAGLSVAVSRLLATSLDATDAGAGVNLVDTFSMLLGSHLVTVHTSSHAAFLNVDVTLRAGLIVLLLVPLLAIILGTTLFTWRFRTRALMSPALYAGLTGICYAVLLSLIALLTHGRIGETFISGLIIGSLFAIPGAYIGLRRPKPPASGEATSGAPESGESPTDAAPQDEPPAAATAKPLPASGGWVPALVLGVKTLGWELLGLTVFSLVAFAVDGGVARSLLLVPNIAVYALAFLHGPTVSVLSNLQRVGSTSFSLVSGLTGNAGPLPYNAYRFALLLIPLVALIVGGIALERRRSIDRFGAAMAFGLGYGVLGALLAWACSIRLEASGAAVSLLADSGTINVAIGAPWLIVLLFMTLAAVVLSYVGASFAGRRAAKALIVLTIAIAAVTLAGVAAERLVPALSGLFGSRAVTFSVALPDLQQCTAFAERSDGGYVVAGYAPSDAGLPAVVTVDKAGVKVWAQTIDLSTVAGATDPGVSPAEQPAPPPAAGTGSDTPDTTPGSHGSGPSLPGDDGTPELRFIYHWSVKFVAVAPGGETVIAGTRFGTAQTAPGRFSLLSAGPAPDAEDAYVARLDPQGRALWVAVWRDQSGGAGEPISLELAPDDSAKLMIRIGRLGNQKVTILQVGKEGKVTLTADNAADPGTALPSFSALAERQCIAMSAASLYRGGTVVCGYTTVAADAGKPDQKAFLALLDSGGNIKWLRSPESTDMPALSAVRTTSDGGYAAVGIRGSTAWMIKTDRRGLIKQDKSWK